MTQTSMCHLHLRTVFPRPRIILHLLLSVTQGLPICVEAGPGIPNNFPCGVEKLAFWKSAVNTWGLHLQDRDEYQDPAHWLQDDERCKLCKRCNRTPVVQDTPRLKAMWSVPLLYLREGLTLRALLKEQYLGLQGALMHSLTHPLAPSSAHPLIHISTHSLAHSLTR